MVRLLEQHNNNNNLSWGSESELGSPVNLTPIIILLSKRRTITQTSNLSFYFCTREKFGFEEDDNRNSGTLVELFEHKNTFDSNITDVMLHPLWNGAIEFRTARKVIRSQLSHYFSSSSRPFFGLSIKYQKSNYSAIKLMTFAQQTKKMIMKTIVSVIPWMVLQNHFWVVYSKMPIVTHVTNGIFYAIAIILMNDNKILTIFLVQIFG